MLKDGRPRKKTTNLQRGPEPQLVLTIVVSYKYDYNYSIILQSEDQADEEEEIVSQSSTRTRKTVDDDNIAPLPATQEESMEVDWERVELSDDRQVAEALEFDSV